MGVICMLLNVATPVILTNRFNVVVAAIVDYERHIGEHLIKAVFRGEAVLVALDFYPSLHAGGKVIDAIKAMVFKLRYSVRIGCCQLFLRLVSSENQ